MWLTLISLAFLSTHIPSNATAGPWTAELNGNWLWHAGDNMQWTSPSFDDSTWPVLHVPGRPPSAPRYWIRIPVRLGPVSDPGLLLGPIAYAYDVFWDGQQIGSFGQLPPHLKWFSPRWQTFQLPSNLAKPGDHIIALQVWNGGWAQQRVPSLSSDDNRVGDLHALREVETSLKAIRFRSELLLLILQVIVVVAGLYFLLLPPSVTQGPAFRLFGTYLLGAGLYVICVVYADYGPLGVPANLIFGTGVVAGFTSLAGGIEFSYAMFGRRVPVWTRCFEVLLVLVGAYLLTPVLQTPFYPVWRILFWNGWLLAVLIPPFVAGLEVRRRSPGSGITFVLFVLIALTNVTSPLRDYYGVNLPSEFHAGPFRLFFNAAVVLWIPAMAMQIHKTNLRVRAEGERLRGEMEAARHVQELLVPAQSVHIPGFDIDADYQPATEVGGDFFQLFPAPNDALLVVVGDVSGKGMKAALVVSVIVGALQNRKSDQPAAVLGELNQVLLSRSEGGFTTCCCGLFTSDGSLTIANAGHLTPYRNGQEIETPPALPLGVDGDARWTEAHIDLQPNDRVLWISDGVVEARNGKRDLLGFQRAKELATLSVSEIARAARQFGQEDDITVVSITRQPVASYVA